MEEKKKKKSGIYSAGNLSAFCLQVSLLLSAAVPLEEGLSVMAEDARTLQEKKLLQELAEDVELGEPLFAALERTGEFPPYVVKMAKLGHQTGTLDQIMKDLSVYYEKEFQLMRSIQNALTYPVMMIFMLLTVLFVLFTKVMPIFEGVYEQLGAQMSPLSRTAYPAWGDFQRRCAGFFRSGGSGGTGSMDCLQVWKNLPSGGKDDTESEAEEQTGSVCGRPPFYSGSGFNSSQRHGTGKGHGTGRRAGGKHQSRGKTEGMRRGAGMWSRIL